MRKLLIILTILIIATGCGNNSKSITGYWSFLSIDNNEFYGVAEIDSLNFMWYYDGIGYVPTTYFIKADSLYYYNIVDRDTIINYRYSLKFINENNFVIKNKDEASKYERITEEELNEFIDERESRIEKGEEEDIVPIIEKKN